MDSRAMRGRDRVAKTDRAVALRASRSRRLLHAIAARVPERGVAVLNGVAFASLAAALVILLLV